MRRLILVPVLVFVALLAIAGAGAYWFYNSYNFYSTDDAQISGQILNISSPQAGQLTQLNVKQGDKVQAGQVIGSVAAVAQTGQKVNVNLTSPIDGTIVQETGVEGQLVSAGLSLAQVVDLSKLNVTAYVDETQLNNIKNGQDVDVSVDAYSGESFTGHIDHIVQATAGQFSLLPSSDNSSGNFTKVGQRVPVVVSLDGNGGHTLVPGLSATVKIHLH
ncbi:HlyD family secretion protein [Ktedonobacter racemifer]|uniref:Secretion protein HlyD family protein n=1 Tax=Ktedonobacter racemifer DSM 44963 TaxID=485913 RepID=D6TEW3_KTERA|nr:efflux RND transporter periplasmic adaptor subunit [Ktedonobacter racemifer]EFH88562.1 secretion protein HlyD family protein [Ktedonobacter racemifer DSM 44963]